MSLAAIYEIVVFALWGDASNVIDRLYFLGLWTSPGFATNIAIAIIVLCKSNLMLHVCTVVEARTYRDDITFLVNDIVRPCLEIEIDLRRSTAHRRKTGMQKRQVSAARHSSNSRRV